MIGLPRLAITLGDPRGIGPEIVRKALANRRQDDGAGAVRFVVVGPAGTEMPVDESVGAWTAGGSAAEAGRVAGLAIERAVALTRTGAVQGHRHRADRQGRAARRGLRLSRPHRDARGAREVRP
jgi:Pyridoxal phosphate biosynthesis protein